MTSTPRNEPLPSWMAMEERKVGRLPLGLFAQMSSDRLDPCRVVIRDLSNLGCRVSTSQKPVVGTLVTIALAHFTEINGWIAWAKSGDVGIDFAHPLPVRVVEYVIEMHGNQTAQAFDLSCAADSKHG